MPHRIVAANGAGQDSSDAHGARGNVGGAHEDVAAHGHIGSHAALHGEDPRGVLSNSAPAIVPPLRRMKPLHCPYARVTNPPGSLDLRSPNGYSSSHVWSMEYVCRPPPAALAPPDALEPTSKQSVASLFATFDLRPCRG